MALKLGQYVEIVDTEAQGFVVFIGDMERVTPTKANSQGIVRKIIITGGMVADISGIKPVHPVVTSHSGWDAEFLAPKYNSSHWAKRPDRVAKKQEEPKPKVA